MGEYIVIAYGNGYATGKCVICGRFHEKCFPEGFPDEWKLCCGCLLFADHIAKDFRHVVEESYKPFPKYAKKLMKRLDKIEKLISLVG